MTFLSYDVILIITAATSPTDLCDAIFMTRFLWQTSFHLAWRGMGYAMRHCPRHTTCRLRCFHKLFGISYRDHITNEEVKARTGNAIGPYKDLPAVKRRKLMWYGHATRSSGLAKTILQGTVQGSRRRGRQRKRWEDNIKEWTGLEWNITTESWEPRGVEEAGCKIYSGAPTVIQTTG